ncbi:hypothetical protein LZZ85_04225 [Terrimonas sp. NA20]|uniref:Cupin domain-containing protein n=1 Tax=Terrimonas ginsenosidimutans TaxID=2908004 RepID=A0ABS9KME8_9BACT|nr:cupin domain-containing protein [Terrimonas ginsenosidimutans]MCG2613470.1 hypothetical protein [Terrimonas ginsenosidimutans]
MISNKNNTLRVVSTFMVLAFFHLTLIAQQSAKKELRLTPQEIRAVKASGQHAPGSSNLSAVEVIVIYGDPSVEGLYTILLKVAPNTKIPAHLHPDERVGTVVSGTWYFGYGDKFSEAKLKKLPPGSVYTEDKNINHFAMTGKDPVIVALTGYGPSGVTYVNAADDPAGKK